LTVQDKTTSSPSANNEYARLLGSGTDALEMFNEAMMKLNNEFCEAMHKGHDFTIKLEVHGNKGEMIHARTTCDSFRRPDGAEKRIQKK